MQSKKYDVIVVGELNVDLILNEIAGFPEIGKEILADQMTLTLGSSSAIFASNLSSLGANVAFLGKVGQDQFGELVIKSLQQKGVSTEFIIQDENLNTGATIVMNYDQDRANVTHPGAMEHLTIHDINADTLKNARHLHFSSLFLQQGMKKNVGDLFTLAKENGLTTSFDMQWDPAEKWDLDYKAVLPYVDLFFPNKQELFELTGKNNMRAAINILDAPNTIVVKCGSEGSHCWQNDQETALAAFLNENVVDAIGAGDSFNAGFVFKFVAGASIQECQRFGNLCGAINTTAIGGTTAFTDYDSVMKVAGERFDCTDFHTMKRDNCGE